MQSRPGLDCPPLPPGARQIPSGRGFLFLLQILRRVRHLSRRKRRSWREPRRREASGEQRRARTGQGAQARVEVAQNLGRGGAGRNTGGGSDMIQFVRRPKSLGRNTGRFGQTPYRIQPLEGPKTDLETTNREGFQNR